MLINLINMKIIYTFCLVLSVLFFSECSKENQNLQNLPDSLKEIIAKTTDCSCNPFINEYEWRNETVYVSSCGGPACDCYSFYYDENGEQIKMDSASSFNFQDSAKLIKHVWSCHN